MEEVGGGEALGTLCFCLQKEPNSDACRFWLVAPLRLLSPHCLFISSGCSCSI